MSSDRDRVIPAYPLEWPAGWRRTRDSSRIIARFRRGGRTSSGYAPQRQLTIAEASLRVRQELDRMGVREGDYVLSTNLTLRLDGQPRSGQPEPSDPGVAVYWIDPVAGGTPRCMAIDRYDRVADNLAAVAATLDAMRAIERHGGAEILQRAYTGFTALAPPADVRTWWQVLGVAERASGAEVLDAYRRLRRQHHPDHGGAAEDFHAVQTAYEQAQREGRA
ncbi:J domain-containing protein [Pseudoxanthomonas winnipegensis]|uniref:J domain-containing protein n=1 Tax=Pseudoxanthomonas winnipegensis TaxID=2480810 RepID=A0ABY1WCF0_9GAMM|nr:J domain-containing protein [Pseudoxanthomonas winnipegensis]TAA11247.1 J domain-containing protein [Pseudoxanthomonas winnipegensis]TAA18670.1 J domain-containing protein [Pseudoxanthomonas winnipegensis]TAH73954.1 J domain-containing protein [Pseudoxanthomonas winnipegensis]